MQRPRFKRRFRVQAVPPDQVELLSENPPIVLEGRLYALLAPYLDGQHTAAGIAESLSGELTILDVEFGLAQLRKQGYLEEEDPDEPPGVAVFRDYMDLDRETFYSRRAAARIAIHSIGSVDTAPLRLLLESLGMRLTPLGEAGLTLVVVEDYLAAGLPAFNRQAIQCRQPWMLVKPVGVICIGPVFHPPRTACWECLAPRLRASRFPVGDDGNESRHPPPAAILPSISETAFALAATETLKWIVREDPHGRHEMDGALLTLNLVSLTLDRHVVIRREDCGQCGTPPDPASAPEPLILQSRRKAFCWDGGHRSALSEATYQKYARHVSPHTGIIRSLAAMDADPQGLVQVCIAVHNFSLQRYRDTLLAGPGDAGGGKSAGKGMTSAQARASALCEGLERYCGIFRGSEKHITSSCRALGDLAVHPAACLHFSEEQYQRREEWNAREAGFNWVPDRFDEHGEVAWTPVWSLTHQRFKYLPTAYCYYRYPAAQDHDFCRADSNGNAAGSSLEDAIVQGFLELVERDCVALWWYNRLRRPGVDLERLGHPYAVALQRHYRALGRDLWVLDLAADFPIPCYAAVSVSPGGRDFIAGFGAHFSTEIAVARALTEMNQFLHAAAAGRYRAIASGDLGCEPGFLVPNRDLPPREVYLPEFRSDNLLDDITTCVELARDRGLEVLVLDQTRADVGIPVVKVIVPGLRPFWARFAPGRLYQVPVTLGWLPAPLAEDQLNPAHLAI